VTRNWAREHVLDNIRVNAVAPGIIMTPSHTRDTPADELAKMQATVPMNRIGEPAACPQTMLFLASYRRHDYATCAHGRVAMDRIWSGLFMRVIQASQHASTMAWYPSNTRLLSLFCRKYCQMFSTGFSSGL